MINTRVQARVRARSHLSHIATVGAKAATQRLPILGALRRQYKATRKERNFFLWGFHALDYVASQPRVFLARWYLRGEGIEIGALNRPLAVPSRVRVRYVDRFTQAELRALSPALSETRFVDPDIIDDGETLTSVADASVDFVIANHFLEHCENPIGTVIRFVECLRPNGVLFLAVPDQRLTFDSKRAVTSFEHLLQDHVDGPSTSRHRHYGEWAVHVDGLRGADAAARARALDDENYSIHFHTWTPASLERFFAELSSRALLPELEKLAVVQSDDEIICVLRKVDPATPARPIRPPRVGDLASHSPGSWPAEWPVLRSPDHDPTEEFTAALEPPADTDALRSESD